MIWNTSQRTSNRKRTVKLQISIDDELLNALRGQAETHNISLPAEVRHILLRAVGRRDDAMEELMPGATDEQRENYF